MCVKQQERPRDSFFLLNEVPQDITGMKEEINDSTYKRSDQVELEETFCFKHTGEDSKYEDFWFIMKLTYIFSYIIIYLLSSYFITW